MDRNNLLRAPIAMMMLMLMLLLLMMMMVLIHRAGMDRSRCMRNRAREVLLIPFVVLNLWLLLIFHEVLLLVPSPP
jgi:hypothetical protein